LYLEKYFFGFEEVDVDMGFDNLLKDAKSPFA
jgi:hypothetical protein